MSVLGQEKYSSGGTFSFILATGDCQGDRFGWRSIEARADTHTACAHTAQRKGTAILLSKNDFFFNIDRSETWRGVTFMLPPSHPLFPSLWSDLLGKSRADTGKSFPGNRMGSSVDKAAAPHAQIPSHLIAIYFSTQRWSLQSLPPRDNLRFCSLRRTDSGTFSSNFRAV